MKRIERLLRKLSPEQKSYLSNMLKSFSPSLFRAYKSLISPSKASEKNTIQVSSWSHMERTIIRLLDWYFHPTHKSPQIEEVLKHIRILILFKLYNDAEKLINRTWQKIEKTENWHYGFQLLELQKQLYSSYRRTEKYASIFALQKRLFQIVNHLTFLQKISWTLEKWWIQGGIILRNPKQRLQIQKWMKHPIFHKSLPVHTPRFQVYHWNTLGILSLFNAEPQPAYHYFMKAYHLAKTYQLDDLMMIPLINSLAAHSLFHNIQEEIFLLETILENWTNLPSKTPLFAHATLANILHIAFKYGDMNVVKLVYNQTKPIIISFQTQTSLLSLVYQNMAIIAAYLEHFSEAFHYCEKAMQNALRSYHLPFLLLFQAILAYEMNEWSLLESRLRKTYRLLLSQPNPFPLEQFLLKAIREITKKGLAPKFISSLEKNYLQLLQQHPYDKYYLQSTQFPFQEWIELKKSNQQFSDYLKKRNPSPKLEKTIISLLSLLS